MKQQIQTKIATALLTTAFATTLSNSSLPIRVLASDPPASQALSQPSATIATSNVSPQPSELSRIREIELPEATEVEEGQNASVYAYQIEEDIAATLYVRGIPVLTFLNQDPVNRAIAIAEQLNQLPQSNFNAESITVSWNQDSNSPSIKIGDQDLVRIDDNTILADTTENLDEDALQATNRLRRLLGNAAPLTEIAGEPKSAPKRRIISERSIRQIRGIASWYGPGFHGRRSASGERYNQNDLTAAHKTLPFGTRVRVTNLNNGRSVVVRINDRGPYSGRRVIDLSAAAARTIGMINTGTAQVKIEILE